MPQFRLSDLLFAVVLAALTGLAYRLQLLSDPSLYLHWRPIAGITACVVGLSCLAAGRDGLGIVLTLAGAFWTALDSLFMQVTGYGWIADTPNEEVAREGWAAACCGVGPVGLTLVCVVWIAYRRDWSVPWWVFAALAVCWIDLVALALGNWYILMHIAEATRD